jgi:hypothetical protein
MSMENKYSKMTVSQLKKLLEERSIEGRTKLTKKDAIISVLEFFDQDVEDKKGLSKLISELGTPRKRASSKKEVVEKTRIFTSKLNQLANQVSEKYKEEWCSLLEQTWIQFQDKIKEDIENPKQENKKKQKKQRVKKEQKKDKEKEQKEELKEQKEEKEEELEDEDDSEFTPEEQEHDQDEEYDETKHKMEEDELDELKQEQREYELEMKKSEE